MSDTTLENLAAGREAFARHEWAHAYELLRASDAEAPLGPEDLEQLAEAARWSRHYHDVLDTFERAQVGFVRAGDRRGAALVTRVALDGLDGRFTTSAERALQLKGLAEPVLVATVDWR